MVLDRRRFMTGGWPAGPRDAPGRAGRRAASCGVLVQAHPARLDQTVAAILAIGDIDVVARDPDGRLSLAVTGETDVAQALIAIAHLPGVLSATLSAPSAAEEFS